MSNGYWYEEIPPDERPHAELLSRAELSERFQRMRRQLENKSDYARASRAKYKKTHPHQNGDTKGRKRRARWRSFNFVGVDGEGGGVGKTHDYLLLRAGDRVLDTCERLTTLECFSFLAGLEPSNTYVGYYFDYDVTMIIKDLPFERLQRLYDNTKNNMSVEWHGYEFHYRPHKYFRIRRTGAKKYVTVNDVGSFFQCSFVKALKSWNVGTKEQITQIEHGKLLRSQFVTITELEKSYNAMEIELLEALMSKFAAACRSLDLLPRHWQGPGELASALLEREGLPLRSQLEAVPLDIWEHANSAYYGGRFEVTQFGELEPPIYNYDINSAYPDSLRKLPCLVHARWTLTEEPDPAADYYLTYGKFYRKSYRLPRKDNSIESLFDSHRYEMEYVNLYGLPIRAKKTGTISWPAAGAGWYWSAEVQAARHQTFIHRSTWNLFSECDCEPFAFVEPLYKERKRLEALSTGTTGQNMGIALKLVLNSLYGKMAQSIGKPRYANPIYASLITSLTRAKLYDMVHNLSDCEPGGRCGIGVVYLATDGILSTNKARDDSMVGKDLGQWDYSVSNDKLLMIQSGLYIGAAKTRTRGIPLSILTANAQLFWDEWDRFITPIVEFYADPDKEVEFHKLAPVRLMFNQFAGHIQSVSLGKPKLMGTWQDIPNDYIFNWHGKRTKDGFRRVLGRSLLVGPLDGSINVDSLAYTKEIGNYRNNLGKWYERRVWISCQPDWATTSLIGEENERLEVWGTE